MRTFLVTLSIVASLLLPASASAAGWTQVSEHNGGNTDESGMIRGADGTLHVVYVDQQDTSYYLRYRSLTPNGNAWSAPTTVVGPWVGINGPDLDFVGGKLHAFWGGQGTTDVTDPTSSGKAWYAVLDGGAWTRSVAPMTYRSSPYASSQISSEVDSSGTPWISWTGTSILAIHQGLDAGSADEINLSDGCCQYASNIGRDAATGDLYAIWSSNVTDTNGVYSRRISPSLGDTVRLASTATAASALSRTHRLAAASRTTGGVYSAYCDTYPMCDKIRVAGTSGPSLVLNWSSDTLAEASWVAAAPNGRMWLTWGDYKGRVSGVRSNRALTKWGPVQNLGSVAGNAQVWNLNGEGSKGFLDVVVNATGGSGIYEFHKRVSPALSVQLVSVLKARSGARIVTLKVTDAGDAIVGARVRLRSASATSRARGVVRITLPASTRAGVYRANASYTGYAPAYVNVRIR